MLSVRFKQDLNQTQISVHPIRVPFKQDLNQTQINVHPIRL